MHFLLLRRSSKDIAIILQRRQSQNFHSLTLTRIRAAAAAAAAKSRRSAFDPCCLQTPTCLAYDNSLNRRLSARVEHHDDKSKERRADLPGRSLLFSLPVVGGNAHQVVAQVLRPDEDDSSDDDEDGVQRPMFNLEMSCLANLATYYLHEHGHKITAADFTGSKISFKRHGSGPAWHAWNSVFTCPLTGTTYRSGLLRQKFQALEDVPGVDDRTVMYSKRKVSEHAAAGRALDAIQFKVTGLIEPRFCEENPSLLFDVPRRQQTTETTLFETPSAIVAPPPPAAAMELESSHSPPPPPTLVELSTPADYYFTEHGLKISADSFVTERLAYQRPGRKNATTTWTSVFTCPLSGNQYPSGTLRTKGGSSSGVLDVGPDEARIFYRKKASAESAASMRALDMIRFQKKGILEPRFCQEDPSRRTQSPRSTEAIEVHDSSDAVGVRGHDASVAPLEVQLTSDLASDEYVGDGLIIEEDLTEDDHQDASSMTGRVDIEEEDEDDYVVSHIPGSFGSPPSHRLLEVASNVARSVSLPAGEGSSALPKITGGHGAKAAIDVANAWLSTLAQSSMANSAQKGNPHRLSLPRKDTDTTLLCAKTILASLMVASQASPVGHSAGIEPVAKKVLDALWRTDNAKPDADAYTFYLKCLDGANPKVALEKAETIVEAMMSGAKYKSHGGVLPKPIQCTFNALIQISAQIGGTSGRIAKHTDQDFVADRESFLAVLSSSIYPAAEEFETRGLDTAFAKECIQRMTELAAETGDTSFQPDTQTYNAPLRWSGGPVLWAESRPYARFLPWDNYEQIYSKGLRENTDDDDMRIREAKEMEAWFDMMDEGSATNQRMAPDIETYEAVIQGWLRTSTREGLERAEALAKRLQQANGDGDPIRARLQTFHPIIAAWYHSRDSEGPARILEHIKRWEEISFADGTWPDARILEMQMIACLKEQGRLLTELKSAGGNEQVKTSILDAAVDCSRVLKTVCDRFEQGISDGTATGQPIDARLFAQTVRAWENVAVMDKDVGESEAVGRAFAEMISSFALFESVVQAMVSSETSHGVALREQNFSLQLEHMMLNAQLFFSSLVGALGTLDRSQDLSESLLLIEKMTRMIGEFEDVEFHCVIPDSEKSYKSDQSSPVKYSPFGSRIPSDDHFCYRVKGDSLFVLTRYSFLWQVVKFLEQACLDNENSGDVVRLGILIKDICSAQRESAKMKEAVDKILNRVLLGSHLRTKRSSVRGAFVLQGLSESAQLDAFEMNDFTSKRRSPGKASSRPRLRTKTRKSRTAASKTRKINGAL